MRLHKRVGIGCIQSVINLDKPTANRDVDFTEEKTMILEEYEVVIHIIQAESSTAAADQSRRS